MSKWKDIWESRSTEAKKLTLPELLAANGFDNNRSIITPSSLISVQNKYWNHGEYLDANDTIFDVGCGSGAFLWFLHAKCKKVGGIDLSQSLLNLAKANLINGCFSVGEAIDLDTTEKYSHVLSFSVFLYFESYKYATAVLDKMVDKAEKSVMILDIPDIDMKAEDEAMRKSTYGADYDKDYEGLSHLYYSRDWYENYAKKNRLSCKIFDQDIEGYENGKYRFCVILTK